jgi:molecular chaperone GrpE
MQNEEQHKEDEIINEAAETTEETVTEETTPEPLSETEMLQIEVAELKDKHMRLYSEFDNFRKRTAREKIELVSTASEKVIVDLLSVLDDYDRAVANAKEGEISDGVALIFTKLTKTLEAKGLKEMEAKDQVFDADLHEAITQFPAPSEDLKGKVFDVVEKGYYLGEKVIRFAKVVVAN